jgi:hypothetical protein
MAMRSKSNQVDPLSITMRSLEVIRIEAPRSRTRPRNDAPRSRGATFEEVADTTPFELIDPDNPAATHRDIPVARMSCRHARVAIVASFVIAIAGMITFATLG